VCFPTNKYCKFIQIKNKKIKTRKKLINHTGLVSFGQSLDRFVSPNDDGMVTGI